MSNKLQFFPTMIMAYFIQSGVVVFSLPRLLADSVGTNGWIALFLFSFVVFLNIYLISWVYRQSNRESIFEITRRTMPKLLFYPFCSILVIIWAMLSCLIAKEYILIVKSLALPTSNPIYMFLILQFLIILLTTKGITSISHAAVPFFYIIAMAYLILLMIRSDIHLPRMTPFLFKEAKHTFNEWLNIYLAFLGYELSIVLFPYTSSSTRLIRAFQYANIITTVQYAGVSFAAFGFFSLQQLTHTKYPVLNVLSYVQLPFAQRIDNLIFTLTIIKVLITCSMFTWAAADTLRRLLPSGSKPQLSYSFLLISLPVTLFILPNSIEKTEQWLNRIAYAELSLAVLLPVLMLLFIRFDTYRRHKYGS